MMKAWNRKLVAAMQSDQSNIQAAVYDVMAAMRGPDATGLRSAFEIKSGFTSVIRGWAMRPEAHNSVGGMVSEVLTNDPAAFWEERLKVLRTVRPRAGIDMQHCINHCSSAMHGILQIERWYAARHRKKAKGAK